MKIRNIALLFSLTILSISIGFSIRLVKEKLPYQNIATKSEPISPEILSASPPLMNVNPPIELIFVGDILLDRGVYQIIQRFGKGDFRFPFVKLADKLQKADLVFGNLEGPISNKGQDLRKIYSFRMSPEAISGLKFAGFGILSIANNHIGDWGKEAFNDTLSNLENAGIIPIGAGRNYKEAYQAKILEIKGIKIAFLAFSDFLSYPEAKENEAGIAVANSDKIKLAIKEAKEKADLIVVSFHFGEEYQKIASFRQEELAQLAIDGGADLVIGHHPHVVQSLKESKSKYIAYSLGNFVFDQGFSQETMEGGLLKVEINSRTKSIESVKLDYICLNNYFQPDFC